MQYSAEQERWERFCRTGSIADYLAYRSAAGAPYSIPYEEPEDYDDAENDGRFGD